MASQKFIVDIDFDKNQSISRVIENRNSTPPNPIIGQEYYDVGSNQAFFWNGTSWVQYGGGGTSPFIPPIQASEIKRGIIGLNNTTTVGTYADYSNIITGTSVALIMNSSTITKLPKVRIVSSTSTTNSVVGMRFGGNSLIQSREAGFRFIGSYLFSDITTGGIQQFVANARQFCGLTTSTGIVPISNSVTVQSLLNIIGIGSDAGDTNLHIYHNDGSGSATRIDLGVNFPANKSGAVANGIGYQLELYSPIGGAFVNYIVTRLTDGFQVQGTINNKLPNLTTLLCPQVVRTSGSTASVVSIDFMQLITYTLN